MELALKTFSQLLVFAVIVERVVELIRGFTSPPIVPLVGGFPSGWGFGSKLLAIVVSLLVVLASGSYNAIQQLTDSQHNAASADKPKQQRGKDESGGKTDASEPKGQTEAIATGAASAPEKESVNPPPTAWTWDQWMRGIGIALTVVIIAGGGAGIRVMMQSIETKAKEKLDRAALNIEQSRKQSR